MHDRQQFDEWSPVSRRQALLGLGTVAASGGLGLVMADDAAGQADVSVDSFDVADASFEAESVTPDVSLSLSYNYDAASAGVSALVFELDIDGTLVASDELVTDRAALEGTTDLRGRLTDSDQWDSSDFAPAIGESVSRDVTATVRFKVVDRNDAAIVSDTATDTATVTVTHPQDSALVAEVGGAGEIVTASE